MTSIQDWSASFNGSVVDSNVPSGKEWHRDLLQQMNLALPEIRPMVLTDESIRMLDEFLRFRHVVCNVYALSLDIERLALLVRQARPAFTRAQTELLRFADFLEQVGRN